MENQVKQVVTYRAGFNMALWVIKATALIWARVSEL